MVAELIAISGLMVLSIVLLVWLMWVDNRLISMFISMFLLSIVTIALLVEMPSLKEAVILTALIFVRWGFVMEFKYKV